MGVFWIGMGWLAVSSVVGILLGRAIALSGDGRLAERSRRVPDEVRGVLVPAHRKPPHVRLASTRRASGLQSPHLPMIAVLAALGACAVPTSDEPRVTARSGNSTTVEYSGERAGEADRKADEACAKTGKEAGQASTTSGATGGTVRTYDCKP